MESVELPLVDDNGRSRASIRLSASGRKERSRDIIDQRDRLDEESRHHGLAPVQLFESSEYRYRIQLPDPLVAVDDIGPAELFDPDRRVVPTAGRLRTGNHVGTLRIEATLSDNTEVHATVEVRARKLGYLDDFQYMLRDLADAATELIAHRFAPTSRQFGLGDGDVHTLTQRVAVIRSILRSPALEAALQQILRRPYVAWRAEVEDRRIARGVPSGSAVLRTLVKAGRRIPAPPGLRIGGLESLPKHIPVTRTVATVDNVPNRFVRFVLEGWRDLVDAMAAALRAKSRAAGSRPDSGPVTRGLRECDGLRAHLTGLLASGTMREVQRLRRFPASNQVLQKRPAYRDVLRAFALVELGATLDWQDAEEVFEGGQRNVAKLYEFWTYITLAGVVGKLRGISVNTTELFEVSADRLALRPREGSVVRIRGSLLRQHREIELILYFNRKFTNSRESWTTRLEPDCSLEIRVQPGGSFDSDAWPSTWLHFDAKYRMGESNPDSKSAPAGSPTYTRDDIYRMHAYRDGIRGSAGSYVLYPGISNRFIRYTEILPGLGAFKLRPTESGTAEGTNALSNFIESVIDLLASQYTQHERAAYWARRAQPPPPRQPSHEPNRPSLAFEPLLNRPPADTSVLIGYVRSPDQWSWIQRTRLYNLRGDHVRDGAVSLDSPALSADLVLLHGPAVDGPSHMRLLATTGRREIHTGASLRNAGYGLPGGDLYVCLQLQADSEPSLAVPAGATPAAIDRLRTRAGAAGTEMPAFRFGPVVVTLDELMRALSAGQPSVDGERD